MIKKLKKRLYYYIRYYRLIWRVRWLEFWTSRIFVLYYKISSSLFSLWSSSLDITSTIVTTSLSVFSCFIILYIIYKYLPFSRIKGILSNICIIIKSSIQSILIRLKFYTVVYFSHLFLFVSNLYTVLLYIVCKACVVIIYFIIRLIPYINKANFYAEYKIIFDNPLFYNGYYSNKLNSRTLKNIFLINYNKKILNSINFFTLIFYRFFLKFYVKQSIVPYLLNSLINFYLTYVNVLYRLKNSNIPAFRLFFLFYPYKFYFTMFRSNGKLIIDKCYYLVLQVFLNYTFTLD